MASRQKNPVREFEERAGRQAPGRPLHPSYIGKTYCEVRLLVDEYEPYFSRLVLSVYIL